MTNSTAPSIVLSLMTAAITLSACSKKRRSPSVDDRKPTILPGDTVLRYTCETKCLPALRSIFIARLNELADPRAKAYRRKGKLVVVIPQKHRPTLAAVKRRLRERPTLEFKLAAVQDGALAPLHGLVKRFKSANVSGLAPAVKSALFRRNSAGRFSLLPELAALSKVRSVRDRFQGGVTDTYLFFPPESLPAVRALAKRIVTDKSLAAYALPAGRELRFGPMSAVDAPGVQPSNKLRSFTVETAAGVGQAGLERVEVMWNRLGHPVLAINFNADGARRMKRLSGQNIGRFVAVLVDGRVVSRAKISAAFGAKAQITLGHGSTKEQERQARALSHQLGSGHCFGGLKRAQ